MKYMVILLLSHCAAGIALAGNDPYMQDPANSSPATQRATGTFEPRRSELGEPDESEGTSIERQLLEKRIEGEMVGEGRDRKSVV